MSLGNMLFGATSEKAKHIVNDTASGERVSDDAVSNHADGESESRAGDDPGEPPPGYGRCRAGDYPDPADHSGF